MAIFLTKDSKVIVQGMTGATGMKHTKLMLADGTNIVGGVNPRKAGTTVDFDGTEVPVFGSVAEAMEKTGANVSVLFVPCGLRQGRRRRGDRRRDPLAVVITEGIAVHDSAAFWAYASTEGQQDPDHRPELPRPDHPRPVQCRHHPGRHHQARPHRSRVEVRHADLPDDVRAP